MSGPPAKHLVISECASLAGNPADKHQCLVDIAYNGQTIQKVVKIIDPFTGAEETQCRWYVEKYASQEPLEEKKARTASSLIDGYGANLLRQLCLDCVFDGDDEERSLLLEIDIYEAQGRMKPDRNGIHRLHWELLEAPSLWPKSFGEIIVRRRVQSGVENRLVRKVDVTSGGNSRPSINVLLVLARDTEVNGTSYQDIDPSVTTKVFFTIQRELKQLKLEYSLNIEVVRPGTFAAFQKHLSRPTGRAGTRHYHLVHFDVHGKIANQVQQDGKRYVMAVMPSMYDTIIDITSIGYRQHV